MDIFSNSVCLEPSSLQNKVDCKERSEMPLTYNPIKTECDALGGADNLKNNACNHIDVGECLNSQQSSNMLSNSDLITECIFASNATQPCSSNAISQDNQKSFKHKNHSVIPPETSNSTSALAFQQASNNIFENKPDLYTTTLDSDLGMNSLNYLSNQPTIFLSSIPDDSKIVNSASDPNSSQSFDSGTLIILPVAYQSIIAESAVASLDQECNTGLSTISAAIDLHSNSEILNKKIVVDSTNLLKSHQTSSKETCDNNNDPILRHLVESNYYKSKLMNSQYSASVFHQNTVSNKIGVQLSAAKAVSILCPASKRNQSEQEEPDMGSKTFHNQTEINVFEKTNSSISADVQAISFDSETLNLNQSNQSEVKTDASNKTMPKFKNLSSIQKLEQTIFYTSGSSDLQFSAPTSVSDFILFSEKYQSQQEAPETFSKAANDQTEQNFADQQQTFSFNSKILNLSQSDAKCDKSESRSSSANSEKCILNCPIGKPIKTKNFILGIPTRPKNNIPPTPAVTGPTLEELLRPLYKFIEGNKCTLCGFETKSKELNKGVRRHLETHLHSKIFKCEECEKSFVTKERLSLHKTNFHSNKAPLECTECGKKYFAKMSLKCHQKTHRQTKIKHTCVICNAEYQKHTSLKEHLMIHTGERPHVCTICNESFRTKGLLNTHSNHHMSEKRYKCTVCDKAYNKMSVLNQHMNIHNKNTTYVCKICNKNFNFRSNLFQHMLIHSNSRKYECVICGMKFNLPHHLKSHLRTHTANNT